MTESGKDDKIVCPKCGSEDMQFFVNLIVKAPVKYWHNLGKTAVRDKDVEIWGAMWNGASWHCCDCGWHVYLDSQHDR